MIPHCDIQTGKIYGCKKGSLKWYHEKGHLEFNKLESSSRLRLFQDYSFLLWMFFLTLTIFERKFILVSGSLLLFFLFVEFYEEQWCWKYAREKFYEKNPRKKSMGDIALEKIIIDNRPSKNR